MGKVLNWSLVDRDRSNWPITTKIFLFYSYKSKHTDSGCAPVRLAPESRPASSPFSRVNTVPRGLEGCHKIEGWARQEKETLGIVN